MVAVAWLLGREAVTAPVVGATSAAHIEDAVAAAELRLGDDEVRFLEELYRPRNVLLHL
jgi:aryl-alcohol dehydrogenase-like predicted oxidoreductase